MKHLWLLPLCSIILTGCGMNQHAHNALTRKNIVVQSTQTFPHCFAYGCENRTDIHFTAADWKPIEQIFRQVSQNPAAEREKIARAIAVFEQKSGIQAGTAADKAGTFGEMFANANQHDCVDESLNTTIYLQLMDKKGLLRHHAPDSPTVRLPLIHSGSWPHQTAVLRENESGELFAVDSWFHDNGYPPEIVPLEDWKDGWKPSIIHRNADDNHAD